MPRLDVQDRKVLREVLKNALSQQHVIRRLIEDAGLNPAEISLPDGSVEIQWHNILNYADLQGDDALKNLLARAVDESRRMYDENEDLFNKYGVFLARQGEVRPPVTSALVTPTSPFDGAVSQPVQAVLLMLSANPMATTRLNLEEEARTIELAMRVASKRDDFRFELEVSVRPRDLADIFRRRNPKLVHFSGHGNSRGIFMLAGDGKSAVEVKGDALAELFRGRNGAIQLVVLNACETADHAEKISRHINYAVGMTVPVTDGAARMFSEVFYRAFASEVEVKEAFHEAVVALQLEGTGEEKSPVLYHQGNRVTS